MPRWKVISPISARDRQLFIKVLNGATYESVCRQFDISPNRAGQIARNTANKIRAAMLANQDSEPDPHLHQNIAAIKRLRAGKEYWLRKLEAYYAWNEKEQATIAKLVALLRVCKQRALLDGDGYFADKIDIAVNKAQEP